MERTAALQQLHAPADVDFILFYFLEEILLMFDCSA